MEPTQGTELERAHWWIATQRVGISSRTIWAVMMGVKAEYATDKLTGRHFDTPRDASDFGLCHDLLTLIPEWRSRLDEVGEVFPKWQPLIVRWDELTALFEAKNYRAISDRIHALDTEMMALDGWFKMGGHWQRKKDPNQVPRYAVDAALTYTVPSGLDDVIKGSFTHDCFVSHHPALIIRNYPVTWLDDTHFQVDCRWSVSKPSVALAAQHVEAELPKWVTNTHVQLDGVEPTVMLQGVYNENAEHWV